MRNTARDHIHSSHAPQRTRRTRRGSRRGEWGKRGGPTGQARGPAPTMHRGHIPQSCRGGPRARPLIPPLANALATLRGPTLRAPAVPTPQEAWPHCNQQNGGTSMRKPGMAARRGVWALARFLHRKRLPGEKEKNALVAAKRSRTNALRSLDKAFFSFSPALGTHGAQKRAKAHVPGLLQDHARVSFIVSGFPACAVPHA